MTNVRAPHAPILDIDTINTTNTLASVILHPRLDELNALFNLVGDAEERYTSQAQHEKLQGEQVHALMTSAFAISTGVCQDLQTVDQARPPYELVYDDEA